MEKRLSECSLFDGVGSEQVKSLLEDVGYAERSCSKGDIIAIQNARYTGMLILCGGMLTAETVDSAHHVIKVEHIVAPALVAPSFLYAADNVLPVTLTASSAVEIVAIEKEAFTSLLALNKTVMVNFMRIISNPNKFVSEKVLYTAYKTIKSRFANYLLNMMSDSGTTVLRNRLTQREMADLFGVTRPALARAMGELVSEGTIYVKGKDIEVLFEEKLRHYAKY